MLDEPMEVVGAKAGLCPLSTHALWICVILCFGQKKISALEAAWLVTAMAPLGESVDTKSTVMIYLFCL